MSNYTTWDVEAQPDGDDSDLAINPTVPMNESNYELARDEIVALYTKALESIKEAMRITVDPKDIKALVGTAREIREELRAIQQEKEGSIQPVLNPKQMDSLFQNMAKAMSWKKQIDL